MLTCAVHGMGATLAVVARQGHVSKAHARSALPNIIKLEKWKPTDKTWALTFVHCRHKKSILIQATNVVDAVTLPLLLTFITTRYSDSALPSIRLKFIR